MEAILGGRSAVEDSGFSVVEACKRHKEYKGKGVCLVFIFMSNIAGINAPHDKKHYRAIMISYASHFLMVGGAIFDLQKLLGHKSVNSTMVYAHLSQSHINEIMENIYFG